jgi:hypothetical protein
MVGFKVGQKVVYPNHGIGTIEQNWTAMQIGRYTPALLHGFGSLLIQLPGSRSRIQNASEVGLRAPYLVRRLSATCSCQSTSRGFFTLRRLTGNIAFKGFSVKDAQRRHF